jgi:protein-tyrosine phosphatase
MSHFTEAIAFLDDVKRQRGRALVHCNLGVNRSGAVAAAYLMTSQQRNLLEVIEYLKIKRHVVLTNKGFRRQLIRFARERGLVDPVEDDVIDGKLAGIEHGDMSTNANATW